MIKNNVMKSLTQKGSTLMAIAALLLFLTGCFDDDAKEVQPTPMGYVSIYHAAPDAPELDITVDNKPINRRPFSYSDYSGYLNFFTGSRNLKFSAFNASNTLIDTTFIVEEGKVYSVFVINRLSSLETLVVTDSAATPATGKAMIRFVNLSPDGPAVDIAVTGESSNLFDNTSFKQATDFKEVDAKTYSFQVKGTGTSDIILSANDIPVRAGGYYTVITRGFAHPPAGNTNVFSVEVL